MNIPNSFKKAIANNFYDKDIEIWIEGKIRDDEGSDIGTGKIEKIDSFKGNFQFTTREYIRQEYGQEIEANAIVTCDKTVAQIGNILAYNSNDYTIKSKITGDSHTILLMDGSGENV